MLILADYLLYLVVIVVNYSEGSKDKVRITGSTRSTRQIEGTAALRY